MSEEGKNRGVGGSGGDPPPPVYGTFQGVPTNYPPPPPALGFPQPVPPPGAAADPSAPPPPYYAQGYQTVPGYAIAEGTPVRERRLPCCGIGLGWFLVSQFLKGHPYPIYYFFHWFTSLLSTVTFLSWRFIIGFFLAAIPWYVGAVLLLCSRVDYREKPGYIACMIAAILATIAIILGVTKGDDDW